MLKWGKRYAKLCAWVEENIEETFSFYRLPRQHHKNLKSTIMLERLMEELKRRTLVVRIFPNAAACLRLVRALAAEIHENFHEQDPEVKDFCMAQHSLPFPLLRNAVASRPGPVKVALSAPMGNLGGWQRWSKFWVGGRNGSQRPSCDALSVLVLFPNFHPRFSRQCLPCAR